MEDEEIINFIEKVEQQPILYNKRSGSYKRTDLKMKKWREIAVAMKFKDTETAMKKWKYLRDKYVKYRREGRSLPTGTGAEDVHEWPYLPYLQFLEPYIQQRGHYSNVDKAKDLSLDTAMQQAHQDDGEEIVFDVYDSDTEGNEMDTVSLRESPKTTPSGTWDESEDDTSQFNSSGISYSYNTPGTSRSSTPGTSRAHTPGTSQSNTPGTSRSTTPATSRCPTPSGKRKNTAKTAPTQVQTEFPTVDKAIENISDYFAKKAADDADSAFCAYVATEMKEMARQKKNKLKQIILQFITDFQE